MASSAGRSIVRRIILTPDAPKPVGPYSQAVLVDHTLYVSGAIGLDKDGNLVPGGVEAEAEQVFKNIGVILKSAGSDYNKVVKTTVLLADIKDWPKLNTIYAKYFTSHHPARAAYAVKDLPKGAKLEVEAIAVVGDIVDLDSKV